MALSLGRPRIVHVEDCKVNDPIDCDFPLNRENDYPPLVSHSGSSFTSQWFQYQVSKLIQQVLSFGVHKSYGQNHTNALQFHQKIGTLLEGLPASFRSGDTDRRSLSATTDHFAILGMHIQVFANAFLLALHRQHSRYHLPNRSLAIDAALKMLVAQQKIFESMAKVSHAMYMLSYYSVDAGLYLAAVLAGPGLDSPQLHGEMTETLNQAMTRLSWMSSRNAVAASGLAAIQSILQKRPGHQVPSAASNSRDATEATHGTYNVTNTGGSSSAAASEPRFTDSGSDSHMERETSSDWNSDRMNWTPFSQDTQGAMPQLEYGFDPFMGVTQEDYTIERFLSELF